MTFIRYNVKLFYELGPGKLPDIQYRIFGNYLDLMDTITLYLIDPEIKNIDIRKEQINEESLQKGKEDG